MTELKWLGTSYPHPDSLSSEQLEKMQLTGQTREQYEAMVRERSVRDQAAPKVGELAPDFEIERLTPAGKRTGERSACRQHAAARSPSSSDRTPDRLSGLRPCA